jgi:hypothetical protein
MNRKIPASANYALGSPHCQQRWDVWALDGDRLTRRPSSACNQYRYSADVKHNTAVWVLVWVFVAVSVAAVINAAVATPLP